MREIASTKKGSFILQLESVLSAISYLAFKKNIQEPSYNC